MYQDVFIICCVYIQLQGLDLAIYIESMLYCTNIKLFDNYTSYWNLTKHTECMGTQKHTY